MNKIWALLMLASIVLLIFNNPAALVTEMTESAMGVINLCVELVAVYAIWLGILEIVDKTGLSEKLAKLLSPLIRFLFKTDDPEIIKMIAMNMSSNILGVGNAATPCGIRAMKLMDDKSGKATPAMIMLLVVNATSIQLLPTTTIGLRTAAGSASPTDIMIPTLVATFITAIFGISLTLLIQRVFKRRKKKSLFPTI